MRCLRGAPAGDLWATMLMFTKRSGSRGQVRFMPGCLVFSLVASLVLTLLLNLIIRAF